MGITMNELKFFKVKKQKTSMNEGMKMTEWKDVIRVSCKPDVENPFRLNCTIKTETGTFEVKNLYGYVASDALTTKREADKSGFYFGFKKGFCHIRDYELLDGRKVKILDCRRE